MVFKRLKIALGAPMIACCALLPASAAATVTTYVSGWQIDRESISCSMAKQDSKRGTFGIAFGLDEDGDANTRVDRINLDIGDERFRAKVPVDLIYTIGGRHIKVRAHPNLSSPFSGTFVTPISADHAALLATAPNALVSDASGKPLFGISLKGYPEALMALKACTKHVETEFWRGRE